jgi:hypothetical protein
LPQRKPVTFKGEVVHLPLVPLAVPPSARMWCSQCERLVADLEARSCRARFCRLVRDPVRDP